MNGERRKGGDSPKYNPDGTYTITTRQNGEQVSVVIKPGENDSPGEVVEVIGKGSSSDNSKDTNK